MVEGRFYRLRCDVPVQDESRFQSRSESIRLRRHDFSRVLRAYASAVMISGLAMLASGQAQGQPYLGLRENAVLVMDVTAPCDGRKIASGKLDLLAAHVSSIRVGVSMWTKYRLAQ